MRSFLADGGGSVNLRRPEIRGGSKKDSDLVPVTAIKMGRENSVTRKEVFSP